MSARLQFNCAFKGPTWLKSVHCMLKFSLKLAIKGQDDPLIVCSWDTRRTWEWGYVQGLSSFL